MKKTNMYLYGTDEVPQIEDSVISERLKLLRENLSILLDADWRIRDYDRVRAVSKAIDFWKNMKTR